MTSGCAGRGSLAAVCNDPSLFWFWLAVPTALGMAGGFWHIRQAHQSTEAVGHGDLAPSAEGPVNSCEVQFLRPSSSSSCFRS